MIFNKLMSNGKSLLLKASTFLDHLENFFKSEQKVEFNFTHDSNISPMEKIFGMSSEAHRPRFASFL